MTKHYSKISGSTGASIGTIIAVFKSDSGSFDINDYPGYLECDGTIVNVNAYPALYAVIGTHYGGATTISTLTPFSDRQNHTDAAGGQFRLPDFRGRKLVGVGGVDGAGSPSLTPSTNPNGTPGGSADVPGCTGGYWIMEETRQGAEYFVGAVTTRGYSTVTANPDTTFSGSTSLQVGPLNDQPLRAAPEHTHILLTSNEDPNCQAEEATGSNENAVSQYGAGQYQVSRHIQEELGFILPFDPPDGLKTHTHKIAEFNVSATRRFDATYDTTNPRGNDGVGNAFYNSAIGSGAALSNANCSDSYSFNITAAQSGITTSSVDFVLTGGTPIVVTATIVPNGDIPLLTRYFRVKYLIKAY